MLQLSATRRRHALGIATLLSVVVMWLSSSFLMNAIFGELQYEKPFLVTYLCTSSFAGYLIPYLVGRYLRRRRGEKVHEDYESVASLAEELPDYEEATTGVQRPADLYSQGEATGSALLTLPTSLNADASASIHTIPIDIHKTILPPLTTRETSIEAMKFCFLWFLANYFSNAALQWTNVSSFTIISAMSGFFTLFIGVGVGVEKFAWIKLLALFISGVTIVSLKDSEQENAEENPGRLFLLGDFVALLGAGFYGCYTTLLKLRLQHESRVDMTLFFGFVGLYCLVFLWPFIFILSALGIEPFELPPSAAVTYCVIANMVITFVSDYLWILAMLMTSPLIVTMGLSLSIPLALLGDTLFKHQLKDFVYWSGALLVLVGFTIVNLRTDGPSVYERASTREDVDD